MKILSKAMVGVMIAGLLTACGADGDPVPPKAEPAVKTGITISGSARVGVSKTF